MYARVCAVVMQYACALFGDLGASFTENIQLQARIFVISPFALLLPALPFFLALSRFSLSFFYVL